MAGTIAADTLTHSTAGSIATNYVVEGSCKAWLNFNGTGTVAVRDSLNLSSLADNTTGDYTVNFTNAFGSGDYTVSGTASGNADASRGYTGQMAADHSNAPTASALRTKFGLGSNASGHGQLYDSVYSTVLNHGDLA
tara:strand:- start:327 stop:737 length:411 start_codon:yes stop_codon:yes gene_type:complete